MVHDGPLAFDPKSLYFPDLDLYLDGRLPRSRAFVSHAHADHFARHQKILCSTETGYLLEKRFGVDSATIHPLSWETPHELDGHVITLFPAGHIAGSAMIHVRKDNTSLLYTGDFKLRESLTCAPPVLPEADILVMETTFGLPRYVFPPQTQIHREIIEFVEAAISDGEVPVLFAYALGKAQEAHALLSQAGIPVVLHNAVYDMSTAYNELGIFELPDLAKMAKSIPPGHALIAPPNFVRSRALRNLRNKRTAMLSGWGLNPSAKFRYQTDEVIPLSDHADFPDLMETVRRVNPKTIYTTHGATREFAALLREQGYDAWSVHGDDQLELLSVSSKPGSDQTHPRPDCPLRDLSLLIERLQQTPSRLKKIELVADFIVALDSGDLRHIVNGLRETRMNCVGPSIIKQSILQASAQPMASYKTISAQQNDAARTARILLEDAQLDPAPYSLQDLFDALAEIHRTPVQLEKVNLLASLLKHCHPMEGETVVRLAGGGIRAGVKDGLLEEAMAAAFDADIHDIRRAHLLNGNLGETAILAKQHKLGQVTLQPGTALKPMLASPATSVDAILAWHRKLETDSPLWVEEKYDGIRAQLHVRDDGAHLFSRDLKLLDDQFPELIDSARSLAPCILDGEIIAFDPADESRKLTFNDIQKRLGKKAESLKQGDLFGGAAVPVSFVAFDCLWSSLWREPCNLFEESLSVRRRELESLDLHLPYRALRVRKIAPDDRQTLDKAFKSALQDGNEGLILKDERTSYMPGRRGRAWMKLKGVMPTLDCVVIAAQQGHGKRAGVLSDYTFAIRDDQSDNLLTLGKAYSGLTDEEIEELTTHFQRTTIGKPQRRVHEVEPTVVLEIAFDRIAPSKRHNSGLALRFPRIKAIRHDKTPEEIDTLSTARSLVKK